MGPSGAGKTVLYSQLVYNKVGPTIVSTVENETNVQCGGKNIHLVDLPGYPKLWFKMNDFMPVCCAILFLVDSDVNGTRNAAEYLYQVLSNHHVLSRSIPVFILCNKQDIVISANREHIQQELEKEIDKLRSTKACSVETQDEEEHPFIGLEGQPFKFEHLDCLVEFMEISCIQSIDLVEKLLQKVV